MPTIAHIIYIPAILMVGVALGWVLGGRAMREALLAEQARKAARAARRADRDAEVPRAAELDPPGPAP